MKKTTIYQFEEILANLESLGCDINNFHQVEVLTFNPNLACDSIRCWFINVIKSTLNDTNFQQYKNFRQ